MIIVGDIGNTETKICLVNSKNIIIKRVTIMTKKINPILLKKFLSNLKLKKIYETFIPLFPKFNIKNIDRNLK